MTEAAQKEEKSFTDGDKLANLPALAFGWHLPERSRFSVSRTAALVVGAPLVGFGIAYVVVCGIGDCEGQTDIQATLSQ